MSPFPICCCWFPAAHTQLILVKGVGDYERWGTTIDDALGEAFDKTAKLLGLPYPGGPAVEAAAKAGDPKRFRLPIPLKGTPKPDFSFSGLKTALRQAAEKEAPLSEATIADLCAAFQVAVTASLADRVQIAMRAFAERFGIDAKPALVVAGGVAANQAIRATLLKLADAKRLPVHRAAAGAVHRQCGDDCLGRSRAHGSRVSRRCTGCGAAGALAA